jgi:hypothetical protein
MKTKNQVIHCRDCVYFKDGECYRHPPVMQVTPAPHGQHISEFQRPPVKPDDFCGEGRHKYDHSDQYFPNPHTRRVFAEGRTVNAPGAGLPEHGWISGVNLPSKPCKGYLYRDMETGALYEYDGEGWCAMVRQADAGPAARVPRSTEGPIDKRKEKQKCQE